MIPSGIININALSLVTSINHKIHSDICIYRSAKLKADYFSCTAFIHTGSYDGRVFFIYVTYFFVNAVSMVSYLDAIWIFVTVVISY